MGRGDNQVGIAGAGLIQNVGVAGKAGHALHVQRIGGAPDQLGIGVDDGDIVALARKMARDMPADLPRTADYDLHRESSSLPSSLPS